MFAVIPMVDDDTDAFNDMEAMKLPNLVRL